MNVPDIIGCEVMTPDGRGYILSLHKSRVIVCLNSIQAAQVMKGEKRETMHYSYKYEDVEVLKGRYLFDEKEVQSRYEQH